MRSRTPPDMEGRCLQCFLQTFLCLCAEIPRIDTRTRVVILRHHKEKFKSSNTARLGALALTNSHLTGYGGPDDVDFTDLVRAPGSFVLFPDAPPTPPELVAGLRQLVVLDGSWSQARRMNQRIDALHGLPRYCLPAPPAHSIRLRQPLHPDGMSTLEAIASALEALEGPEVGAKLFALHALSVRRVLESRGRPGIPTPGRFSRTLKQGY